MSVVLETHNITKHYTSNFYVATIKALEDVSLTVEGGDVFGLIGHNGAGKTTFIKIVTHLIQPTSGQGHLFGRPIGDLESLQRIGFLPERPYFYEYLTPREALKFYGRLSNMKNPRLEARIDELLGLMQLKEAGKRPLRSFSKGMLQRFGMAQAILHDPDLVILDEPMSGLDPVGRGEIRDLISSLKEQGKTIFFSSHILGDVEQLCSKVALFVRGRLRYLGGVEELLEAHELGVEYVFAKPTPAQMETLAALGGTLEAKGPRLHCFFGKPENRVRLMGKFVEMGLVPEQVSPRRPTREEIFRQEYERTDAKEVRS